MNSTCAPIYYSGNDDGITVETYWVDIEHTQCIDYAHSDETPVVGLERENHFKRYGVNPQELRSLKLPKKKYIDALYMLGYGDYAEQIKEQKNE